MTIKSISDQDWNDIFASPAPRPAAPPPAAPAQPAPANGAALAPPEVYLAPPPIPQWVKSHQLQTALLLLHATQTPIDKAGNPKPDWKTGLPVKGVTNKEASHSDFMNGNFRNQISEFRRLVFMDEHCIRDIWEPETPGSDAGHKRYYIAPEWWNSFVEWARAKIEKEEKNQ